MKKIENGFTLIELMIVVAIISILASLSIPAYSTYTKRARFTDIIMSTSLFKTAVALALQEGIPVSEISNNRYGIPSSPTPTENIDSIIVDKGIIKATASSILQHITYILKPDSTGSNWSISGTCLKSNLCHA